MTGTNPRMAPDLVPTTPPSATTVLAQVTGNSAGTPSPAEHQTR
jgi:hypothetical protein